MLGPVLQHLAVRAASLHHNIARRLHGGGVGSHHHGAEVLAQGAALLSRLDVRAARQHVHRHTRLAGKHTPHTRVNDVTPQFAALASRADCFACHISFD